jgi:hypothetical protein
MMKFLFLVSLASAPLAMADDAPLSNRFKSLVHPEVSLFRLENAAARNNVAALLAKQTPVKAQLNRGTCSIFSATALLESMLIVERKATTSIDLSEEWLQYLISQTTDEEGSESNLNFRALRTYGQPSEAKLPYNGESWEETRTELADKRCGHLKGFAEKSCLVSHRDPALLKKSDSELSDPSSVHYDLEFLAARKEAFVNKERFFSGGSSGIPAGGGGIVGSTNAVKSLLDKGIPLTLDLDFFYGSWNHREAEGLGINRDAKLWSKGVVTYPEERSADREYSNKEPAGHSVVVVGYDDNVVVTFQAKMTDGRMKTFKRKGVYYFKNSWGTDKFGAEFALAGKKYPGYGMITQDYAHEFGQFFQLKLK